jgi:ATP phosphoribosyltransferase
MPLKLALPKGRLLSATKLRLQKAGLGLSDYDESSRSYRPCCDNFPDLALKIFQEKDIPIQVAIGNYNLGICGLDWIEELLVKYQSSALVKVQNLGYGRSNLHIAASRLSGLSSAEELKDGKGAIRIASEYPNLAESFALNLRLRRFKVFPLWGAAEVYPPESADLVLIPETRTNSLSSHELVPLATILQSSAYLITNRNSWESKDMSAVLERFYATGNMEGDRLSQELEAGRVTADKPLSRVSPSASSLRLALPDGHQQQPAFEFLNKASIKILDYSSGPRRPTINIDDTTVKIIRPQDMPLQVANGNFDLAITGKDWLCDHLSRFPSSPVKEILELGFGKVRIVAVVSNELPVNNVPDLRDLLRRGKLPILRIASEYINIADRYAQSNHLSPYRLIPTWGASEAFLPEDADLLIENTQTGRTIAEHNLKIIDTLFESSACLIGNASESVKSLKQKRIDSIAQALRQTLTLAGAS